MGIYDETVSPHKDHKLTDSRIKVWIMYMSELWRQKWIKFAMHKVISSQRLSLNIMEINHDYVYELTLPHRRAQKNRSMLYYREGYL